MQFIDRVKEQRRLKEALSSDAPAFMSFLAADD